MLVSITAQVAGSCAISARCCTDLNRSMRHLKSYVAGSSSLRRARRCSAQNEASHSFGTASAHSANMMAVATLFLIVDRKWGTFWLAIAVLTGLSRIYVGVHYPQQVLLGWLVGANAALLTHWVYRKVRDARSAKESSTEP